MAESLDALVLDVKFGAGAFLSSLEDSRTLAKLLVATAREFGLSTTALLTSMEQPTGRMVGNAVEVQEAIETLQGNGPTDLWRLVVHLATELLTATNLVESATEAERRIQRTLESGAAFEKFREMVVAQGGDADAPLAIAAAEDFNADRSGCILAIDGAIVGYALTALGGGRIQTTDDVDPSVGFEFLVRLGDEVKAGQPLVRIFAQSRGREQARTLLDAGDMHRR